MTSFQPQYIHSKKYSNECHSSEIIATDITKMVVEGISCFREHL